MRKFGFLACLCLLGAQALSAQETAVAGKAELPSGESAMDKHIEATGSIDAHFRGEEWRAKVARAETVGIETVEGEECYKVLLTPKAGGDSSTLLTVPVAAQSMRIRDRIDLQDASAYVLHVGESGDALYKGLQALLRSDELSEIVIAFGSVQTTSPDYANFAKELGLARDSRWALTDDKGRCILQGSKLPGTEDLQNALDAAGVKSPVKVLRDFLKQYPDHLDARWLLSRKLRAIAENRTRYALQLDINYFFEIDSGQGAATTRPGSLFAAVDVSPMEGKQLGPEQDIKIWGPYAQELQTLFDSGDWRLALSFMIDIYRQLPVEACSPTMIQIYRRHFAKVEAYLEEYPSNAFAWSLYNWMLAVTKQNAGQSSIRGLLNRLVLLPHQTWPTEEALHFLIHEERAKGNWDFIAETLMPDWPRLRVSVYDSAESIKNDLKSDDPYVANNVKSGIENVWQDQINPLLESLIKTNRVMEAETIIADVARFSAFRDFQRRAAELALASGRSDLRTKWLSLDIPEKPHEPDMNDLEAAFYSSVASTPRLVLIKAGRADRQQAGAMLRQGRLLDWGIKQANLNPALSELMRQKEGWPEAVAYWGLFDTKGKALAYRRGTVPSLGAIQHGNARKRPAPFHQRTPVAF